ncbi:hypothetical protein BES34_012470 [Leptospira inadai serovar Lyme]|uniref:Uncharacterized protein n=1 Tax=Leptospira inadai serovar Lyme TaxID=293084 RepID=A0ABX4YIB7_9LEPT|nr:hypothetical protein BES34_012470 [Leptospira inadai serovar Lyme]
MKKVISIRSSPYRSRVRGFTSYNKNENRRRIHDVKRSGLNEKKSIKFEPGELNDKDRSTKSLGTNPIGAISVEI